MPLALKGKPGRGLGSLKEKTVHAALTKQRIHAIVGQIIDELEHRRATGKADYVKALADAVLSTSGMIKYARDTEADQFLIVTECGLSDRLLLELPEKTFYKSCKLCSYMKMITLEDTRRSLEDMRYVIELDEDVRKGAEKALQRMLDYSS